MTNKETKYAEKLMKFIIGEEVKVKRPKEEKDKDRAKEQSIEMLGGENQPKL